MDKSNREEDLAIIQSMTLMDDIFMTVFFKNKPECVQEILDAVSIKATVTSVDTQCSYPNIYGHSVKFDIKAIFDDDTNCNIEIQKRSDGANPKRARFHSSMLDIISLNSGDDYSALNDTYVIFITQHDVLGYNKPFYEINRVISNVDEAFNDGSHIIYINTAYKGNDNAKITDLIHDFRCDNADEIRNKNIRNRFHEMKFNPTEEEVDEMCELLELRIQRERAEGIEKGFEKGRAEGIEQGIEKGIEKGRLETTKEIARNMLHSGDFTAEKIAEFCHLTVNEVYELDNPA